MNVETVELEPRGEFKCRFCTFVRVTASNETPAGVIEIRESRRPDTKVECRRYAIKEVPVDFKGDRGFRLTKPGGEEWYNPYIARKTDGVCDSCDCKGFCQYDRCVHVEAIHKLIEKGLL